MEKQADENRYGSCLCGVWSFVKNNEFNGQEQNQCKIAIVSNAGKNKESNKSFWPDFKVWGPHSEEALPLPQNNCPDMMDRGRSTKQD